MDFQNIHVVSATCDCLDGATQNLDDTFVRKVRSSQELNISDFRSHSERNKTPEDDTCEEICGLLGVSIEVWNEKSKEVLLQKYTQTVLFGKKLKNKLCIFKLKHGAGVTKYTPNQKGFINEFHYDLYKSDSFQADSLHVIELKPLN